MKRFEDKIFTTLWKTKTCFTGESCWCKEIVLDNKKETRIIMYGEISKLEAEHIVYLHNSYINKDKISKTNLTNVCLEKWKSQSCKGKDCRCGTSAILLKNIIVDNDGYEKGYVISYGNISSKLARYVVRLHNKYLENIWYKKD